MELSLSQEAEEYVEMIYKLQERHGMAKTKELSEIMHVVPGSITNTIEHLESHGLVTHEPYRGVKLTQQGEKIALDIIRRHRLAECLLSELLKAEWSTVHEDACKLEHALSKKLTDFLEERLGHPKFCPHGNPIPTENGSVNEPPCIALTDANLGEHYVVSRIVDEEHVNLQQLSEKRLKPAAKIQFMKQENDIITICVDGKEQHLNWDAAINVFVRKNEEECNNYAATS
jgi:DtxR family transcriptional regulator, Mn-dependent transcriptional regulator